MIYSWKKIVKHGLPLLTVAVVIEIFAGQILQGRQDMLILFPVFLISIPVINSVGGNIGSVLGARLASGLHVGYITISLKDKEMHENLFYSLLIGFITYIILAIVIYYMALLGGLRMGIGLIEFVAILVSTGFLLICVVVLMSVLTAFLSFKRGLDPDDVVAPVVTTVGDTLGIIFLFLLIGVVGV
ncbi:MAG: magnesium transporter [Thermoplasmatales archaeon]|nr:magnesium transporter [Thermoplasmatales archaeon]